MGMPTIHVASIGSKLLEIRLSTLLSCCAWRAAQTLYHRLEPAAATGSLNVFTFACGETLDKMANRRIEITGLKVKSFYSWLFGVFVGLSFLGGQL